MCIISGLELAQKQSENEDLSCLPTLKISDIDRRGEFTDLSQLTLCKYNWKHLTY